MNTMSDVIDYVYLLLSSKERSPFKLIAMFESKMETMHEYGKDRDDPEEKVALAFVHFIYQQIQVLKRRSPSSAKADILLEHIQQEIDLFYSYMNSQDMEYEDHVVSEE